jgi:hypothetical protein
MMFDRVFDNRLLIERLLEPILTPLQEWLAVHPVWNWLLTHPLWLLGVLVLVVFLVAGLLGAIARLTEAVWLAILQAPLRLVQLLFVGVVKLLKMPFAPRIISTTAGQPVHQIADPPISPTLNQPDAQERLTTILDRLDSLRQEQEELIQEVRSILAVRSEAVDQPAEKPIDKPLEKLPG